MPGKKPAGVGYAAQHPPVAHTGHQPAQLLWMLSPECKPQLVNGEAQQSKVDESPDRESKSGRNQQVGIFLSYSTGMLPVDRKPYRHNVYSYYKYKSDDMKNRLILIMKRLVGDHRNS